MNDKGVIHYSVFKHGGELDIRDYEMVYKRFDGSIVRFVCANITKEQQDLIEMMIEKDMRGNSDNDLYTTHIHFTCRSNGDRIINTETNQTLDQAVKSMINLCLDDDFRIEGVYTCKE